MGRYYRLLALLAIVGVGSVPRPLPVAATTQPATEKAASTKAAAKKDSGSTQRLVRGMIGRLNQTMLGQPVIAVGYGEYREDVPWSETAFKSARDLPERLRLIAAKHSPKGMSMVPFRVGSAWVIAPERMDVSITDFPVQSVYELTSRGDLADLILTSLTSDQMRQLAGRDGLPFGSLSPDLQRVTAAMFRTPFYLVREVSDREKDARGVTQTSPGAESRPVIALPDLERIRFRGFLYERSATVRVAGLPESNNWAAIGGNRLATLLGGGPPWGLVSDMLPGEGGMELPTSREAPNQPKPSDLDPARYPQPIGIRGVHAMGEVAARIEKAAGVRLYVGRAVEAPVFLGSESLRCGDVLDGIRLALTNTWRRLDDGFVLAYNLRGLGALQEEMLENTGRMAAAVAKLATRPEETRGWDRVAAHMRFHPDDPLALTDEQRALVFVPPGPPDFMPRRLTFEEMTEGQQVYLKAAAESDARLYRPPEGTARITGQPGAPLCTEADLRTATLSNSPSVVFVAELPEFGVVDLGVVQNYWPWSLYWVNRRAEEERRAAAPAPVRLPDSVTNRAVIVPALRPEEIGPVTAAMKRQGFDTLFYPALFGGYGTFESGVFPEHPALGGQDGWAAAAEAAGRDGIRLVGYVSCLLWQNAGDRPHWLDRHPDWVDRDILGRSRLEWIERYPDFEPMGNEQWMSGNYVRVREPVVAARLKAFLRAFARQPGSRGVLFTEWRDWWWAAPSLGFTVPDRVATLRAAGVDPVDEHIDINQGIPGTPAAWDGIYEWRNDDPVSRSLAQRGDPYDRLAEDLLAQAKALRNDWKTYLMDGGQYPGAWDARAFIQPDARLEKSLRSATDPGFAYSISMRPRLERSRSLASWLVERLREFTEWKDDSFSDRKPSFLVLDARIAPGDIPEALRWVEPPATSPGYGTDRKDAKP